MNNLSQDNVRLETNRLSLHSLSREQMSLALSRLDLLEAELKIKANPGVFSEESRQAMLIKISRMDRVDRKLHPWYTYFLMIRQEDQQAVGVCGFKGPPSMFGWVELGYAMYEPFRNQGFMTEAVRALIDWAFTHETCLRVVAETLATNFASQHVLQKAGLVLDRKTDHMIYWKLEKEGTRSWPFS